MAVAREKGIRVDEPFVLADLFSLMVHLRPAPLVARVATCMPRLRTPIEDWLAREIAVTEYLSDQGASVVAPSRELSPGPHERDGYWISFWTYVLPDPERIPTADDCSVMLHDLHDVLRSYPGELPTLGADDISRRAGAARPGRRRPGRGRRQLAARCCRATACPFWESPGGDLQPLHGDAHPGNLIATRGGDLVWIDFEDVCLGPVEWDLATIIDPPAVAAHHRPDLPSGWLDARELRALQVRARTDRLPRRLQATSRAATMASEGRSGTFAPFDLTPGMLDPHSLDSPECVEGVSVLKKSALS